MLTFIQLFPAQNTYFRSILRKNIYPWWSLREGGDSSQDPVPAQAHRQLLRDTRRLQLLNNDATFYSQITSRGRGAYIETLNQSEAFIETLSR